MIPKRVSDRLVRGITTHIPHIVGRISAPDLASGYEAAW